MRSTIIAALFVLPLLPATAAAQAGAQSPAPESAASAAPQSPAAKNPTAPSPGGSLARDQYIERAKELAGQRAAAHFDQMDANHDGIVDQAEMQAWRSRHSRHARSPSNSAPPQ